MENLYNKASLVLTPQMVEAGKVYSMKPEDRKGDFTFSRSTAATRVNASGNIEKETQNLLVQSNNFGTTWTIFDSTLASGQADKDGGTSAWKFTNNNPYGRVTQDVTSSGVNTFSIYAKQGNNPYLRMQFQPVGHDAYFDLSDGSVISAEATIIDAGTEYVGNGWYRVFASVNQTIDNVRIVHTGAGGAGGGSTGDYFYLQDAQLEQGLVARDYIETTTTAIYGGITDNVPRLDYTDSSCPALLLEPQKTNIIESSEYFQDDYWANLGIHQFDTNTTATTSPMGDYSATKIIADTSSSSSHNIYGDVLLSSGTQYAVSIFAKAAEYDYLFIRGLGLGANGGARFNISTGVVEGVTGYDSATIEDYGNGWYRCIAIGTATSATAPYYHMSSTSVWAPFAGNNSDGIYIFGAQCEAGSYATSYIPTYGSAVTRNIENFSLTGIGNLIGQTEGTFFLSYSGIATTSSENNFFSLADSSGYNRLLVGIANQANKVRTYIDVDTSGIGDNNSVTDITSTTKVAMVYTESGNKVKVYINGTKEVDRTMNDTFTEDLTDFVNDNGAGSQKAQARLEQTMLFQTALTDQEAIDLTTI